MDELDISGKRYISSKRAAKENRYHTDYIGQLIRSGKVIGSKVGRTWYVEEESLAKYLGQPYEAPTTPAPVPEIYIPEQNEEHRESKVQVSGEYHVAHERFVPQPIAAPSLGTESELQSEDRNGKEAESEEAQEEAPHHVSIMEIQKEDIDKDVDKFVKSGLRYIEDDEPLLPQLGSAERKISINVRETPRKQPVPEAKPSQAESALVYRAQRGATHPRTAQMQSRTLLMASVALGAVAFFGSLGLSYFLTANTTVNVANVSSAVQSR